MSDTYYMDELAVASQDYERLLRLYQREMSLANQHTIKTENLRKRIMVARDTKRALERDILSAPIVSTYEQSHK